MYYNIILYYIILYIIYNIYIYIYIYILLLDNIFNCNEEKNFNICIQYINVNVMTKITIL